MENKKKHRFKIEDVLGWLDGNDPAPLEEIRLIHEGKCPYRNDFIKELTKSLALLSPLEHVKLAADFPIRPPEKGWEERLAAMLKEVHRLTKHRRRNGAD